MAMYGNRLTEGMKAAEDKRAEGGRSMDEKAAEIRVLMSQLRAIQQENRDCRVHPTDTLILPLPARQPKFSSEEIG